MLDPCRSSHLLETGIKVVPNGFRIAASSASAARADSGTGAANSAWIKPDILALGLYEESYGQGGQRF